MSCLDFVSNTRLRNNIVEFQAVLNFYTSLQASEARTRLISSLHRWIPRGIEVAKGPVKNLRQRLRLCCVEDLIDSEESSRLLVAVKILGDEALWHPYETIPFADVLESLVTHACLVRFRDGESVDDMIDTLRQARSLVMDCGSISVISSALTSLKRIFIAGRSESQSALTPLLVAATCSNLDRLERWIAFQRESLDKSSFTTEMHDAGDRHIHPKKRSERKTIMGRERTYSLRDLRDYCQATVDAPIKWEGIVDQTEVNVQTFLRETDGVLS